MDTIQILLSAVLTVTTIFLIIVGIQLILLIRDLRLIFKNINIITQNLEKLGISAKTNMKELIGFVSSIKLVLKLLKHTNKNGK